MQFISIQTALAEGSKHSSCLSAQKRVFQQQETSWDLCISLWPRPQSNSLGRGTALEHWDSSPTAAHPWAQFCSTSEEPQGQPRQAPDCVWNSQREAKEKMFSMWKCGVERKEERGNWNEGHWLQGQSLGLRVRGDPDDSLDKALMCSRHKQMYTWILEEILMSCRTVMGLIVLPERTESCFPHKIEQSLTARKSL